MGLFDWLRGKAAAYYYLLTPNHRWGDYGNTLVHGYGGIDEEAKVCRLQRTGPFVPPFSKPGAVVVTDAVRQELEQSGLTGFTFIPVVKKKIVALDWHEWDQDAPYPAEYPDNGEPEEYIDSGEHSPAVAAKMGELWALDIPEVARVERDQSIVESRRELHLILATAQGLDFVRSQDVGYCFVSRRARDWLKARFSKWVEFEPTSER